MSRLVLMLCGLMLTGLVFAAGVQSTTPGMPKIMVVDFELRDVSPIPDVAQEVERTALIDAGVRKALTDNGYELMAPCDALKQASAWAIYMIVRNWPEKWVASAGLTMC